MTRFIQANGLRMHIIEEGAGPLVLLLHGFPEFSGTWRHQVRALATAGYRVVAPDQRGYGQTDCPERVDAYTMLHLVGDVIGLLDALGEQQAVVVGHDWGAPVAWNTAVLRPDRVRAVAGISVPHRARRRVAPTAAMRHVFGDKFYMLYFQDPGVAEREFGADVRAGLRRLLHAASGTAPPEQRWRMTVRDGFLDDMVDPGAAPAWFGEDALDALTAAFTRSGFHGGLAWYRNLDRNWELSAAFDGLTIHQPALFMMGDADAAYPSSREAIEALPLAVPGLRRTVILAGCGHWVGEERPDDVNAALLEFLAGL
ncbi:MAG TPA: alpha/beta hydrolase [Kofleriaceae bacterium]|nr:alpha/beta hydrolase [Kofleriaceae bacterium]